MSSVVEVVEMMKQGLISKEEMITRIAQLDVNTSEVSINYSEKHFQNDPGLIQINPDDYQHSQDSINRALDHFDQFEQIEFQNDLPDSHDIQHDRYMMPNPMPQEYLVNKSYEKSQQSSIAPKNMEYSQFSASQQNNFHQRQTTYQARKEAWKNRLNEEKQQNELKQCTFHPKINKNSLVDSQQRSTQDKVFQRLYQIGENEKLKEMQEQSKFLKEQEEMKECTFKPMTSESSVNAKFHENLNLEKRAPQYYLKCHKYAEQEQCTFKPQVKGITKQMTNAHEYLSENIFDRLTKPRQVFQSVESQDLPQAQKIGSSRSQFSKGGEQINLDEEEGELLLSQLNFWERQAIYEKIKQERQAWRLQQANNELQEIPETLTSKQG